MHIGNVLLSIPGIDQMSRTEIDRYFGIPNKLPIIRHEDSSPVVPSPHQPNYVVSTNFDETELLDYCLLSIHPSAIDPKICDFDESLFWDLASKTSSKRSYLKHTVRVCRSRNHLQGSYNSRCGCMGTSCHGTSASEQRGVVIPVVPWCAERGAQRDGSDDRKTA